MRLPHGRIVRCCRDQLEDPNTTANWNGWGGDITNSRFQSAEKAGLSAADVPNLKLKWSFGLPMNYQTSQPTIFGGRVYIGSMKGVVYSLNAKTGCLYWVYATGAGVRSTTTISQIEGSDPPRYAAYFGGIERHIYALDARTGKLLWKTQIEQHRPGESLVGRSCTRIGYTPVCRRLKKARAAKRTTNVVPSGAACLRSMRAQGK